MILPADEPVVAVSGEDPDRALLVGSGPAAGVGVSSHHDALTGVIARRLAARTGRGTVVESIGKPDLLVVDVPTLLRGVQLHRYDAVVLIAGMEEALSLMPPKQWEQQLSAVLAEIHRDVARDTAAVVVGMPAPTSVGTGTGWRGRAVDRRAAVLNARSASVVGTDPRSHFLTLSAPRRRTPLPAAAAYEAWGTEITAALGSVLA